MIIWDVWEKSMGRTPVSVRAAGPADVASLRELWEPTLRRGAIDVQLTDLAHVVAESLQSDTQSVVVCEHDGQVVGCVFLMATTLTPLNLEPAVLTLSPHVAPHFRRRGVGSALMEAAVRFAEQRGIAHIITAASADSRDGNRFMARLSLSPLAMLRVASTQSVRSRVSSRRPAARQGASTSRQIDRVLAARRIRRERVAG
jgi:predicted N-acetyltransferase YhbS